MNINKEEAKKIAVEFVNRSDSNGFTLTLTSIGESNNSSKYWAAIFEIRTKEGHILDGPLLVLVDDETGEADYLQTVIEKQYKSNL